MRNRACVINEYPYCKAEKRIDIICTNYAVFERMINSFKCGLVQQICAEKAYNRKTRANSVGVRVSKYGSMHDITSRMAIEETMIRDYMDADVMEAELFEDTDNPREILNKIMALKQMRREYDFLTEQLACMRERDCKILKAYLMREKSVHDLAELLGIAEGSVVKRLYRLRKKLKEQIVPFFAEGI